MGTFLTVPLSCLQRGQYEIFLAAVLTALNVCVRCRFSNPGRRKLRRYFRRVCSSSSTVAQFYEVGMGQCMNSSLACSGSHPHLAYALQNRHDMLEKSDVKDGEDQANVPIVAHTLGHL